MITADESKHNLEHLHTYVAKSHTANRALQPPSVVAHVVTAARDEVHYTAVKITAVSLHLCVFSLLLPHSKPFLNQSSLYHTGCDRPG